MFLSYFYFSLLFLRWILRGLWWRACCVFDLLSVYRGWQVDDGFGPCFLLVIKRVVICIGCLGNQLFRWNKETRGRDKEPMWLWNDQMMGVRLDLKADWLNGLISPFLFSFSLTLLQRSSRFSFSLLLLLSLPSFGYSSYPFFDSKLTPHVVSDHPR
jgi:hypothetical protein